MKTKLFTREYVYSVVMLLAAHLGPYLLLSVISVYAMSLTGSNAAAGLMTSVFPLTGLAGRFLSARLLDRMPTKRVLVASLGLLTAASALYLLPGGYVAALVLRGVQGLGYSVAVTALSTHIVDILAPEQRLEGIGYSSLTNTLCSVFGPTAAFAILGPNVDRFFLLFCAVLVAAGTSFAMALLSRDAEKTGVGDEAAGADADQPVRWLAALLPVALLAAVSFSQSAASSFLSLFALAKGFEGIGLYFTLNAVGVFGSRFVMGRIVRALGDRLTVLGSVALIAACTLGIALAGSVTQLYLVAVPLGFATGMLNPVINAHLVKVLPESKSGLANALFFAAGDIGFITGPTFWGVVANAASYETVFTCAAGALAVCAAASLLAGFEGRAKTAEQAA